MLDVNDLTMRGFEDEPDEQPLESDAYDQSAADFAVPPQLLTQLTAPVPAGISARCPEPNPLDVVY
jgi:hypothetical protein